MVLIVLLLLIFTIGNTLEIHRCDLCGDRISSEKDWFNLRLSCENWFAKDKEIKIEICRHCYELVIPKLEKIIENVKEKENLEK